jgi:hypothetical protein
LEFRDILSEHVTVDGGLQVSSTLLTDCTFDDVRVRKGDIALWGVGFRRCRLVGRIGQFCIFPCIFPGNHLHEARRVRDLAMFNAATDWCLDIRAAEFEEGNLYGVPADKVLIDPTDQMRIRRGVLMGTAWDRVDFEDTSFAIMLGDLASGFISGQPDDLVIFAERRSRRYARQLRVLGRLRELGLG